MKPGEGHRILTMENDLLQVSIDVENGAHIFAFQDKRMNIDVLYKDPKGSGNYDVGGWYELFPNAGKGCRYHEIDIPGHGDVQHLPWQYQIMEETVTETVIRLNTKSRVLPIALERILAVQRGKPCLFIQEQIINLSDDPQPFLWGHHVTFGQPFVSPHCRIDIPRCRIYKRSDYGQEASRLAEDASGTLHFMQGKAGKPVDLSYFPDEPFSEMLFIDRMDEHWYNVFNEQLGVGFALTWDSTVFPYLWLWQEHHATMNDPFNGKVSCMALEPQSSNVPILSNAVGEGQAPVLLGKQTVQTWLTAVVHHEPQPVKSVTREGELVTEP